MYIYFVNAALLHIHEDVNVIHEDVNVKVQGWTW